MITLYIVREYDDLVPYLRIYVPLYIRILYIGVFIMDIIEKFSKLDIRYDWDKLAEITSQNRIQRSEVLLKSPAEVLDLGKGVCFEANIMLALEAKLAGYDSRIWVSGWNLEKINKFTSHATAMIRYGNRWLAIGFHDSKGFEVWESTRYLEDLERGYTLYRHDYMNNSIYKAEYLDLNKINPSMMTLGEIVPFLPK